MCASTSARACVDTWRPRTPVVVSLETSELALMSQEAGTLAPVPSAGCRRPYLAQRPSSSATNAFMPYTSESAVRMIVDVTVTERLRLPS